MKVLINACSKLGIQIQHDPAVVEKILNLSNDCAEWPPGDHLNDVKILWQDPGIVDVYARRDVDYQLNDSAKYFFDQIDDYKDLNFIPSEKDVLRTRVRTTGIDEANFTLEDLTFRMVDVGGQRTERRKWIHCFDSVTSVIFCASLSEYDQTLREDQKQNRMHESLQLFAEIINGEFFQQASIVLFLNKIDLFKEKIQKKDLVCCFPEYQGGCNYNNATAFIKNKFVQENLVPTREIYTHFTCAVDTENILHVFNDVKRTVLSATLKNIGLDF